MVIDSAVTKGNVTADPKKTTINEQVTLTVTPDEGYECTSLTVTKEDDEIKTIAGGNGTYTFTMPGHDVNVTAVFDKIKYDINIPEDFVNGSVVADRKTATADDTVTLTVTPDAIYKLGALNVTDENGREVKVTKSDVAPVSSNKSEYYTFTIPMSAVNIAAEFIKKEITEIFTVSSAVNSETVDKDTAKDGTQVEAGDTVKVDIVVDGSDFTNADWTLVYDYSKFEYVGKSEAYSNGIYTFDNSSKGVLKGSIKAPAGETKKDEFEDGKAVITYEFKTIAQKKETTVEFTVYEAHANTYEIAGNNDNVPASTKSAEVTIILIDNSSNGGDEGETVTPIGTFEAETKVYNANAQTGNKFIPEEKFASATITYAAAEDGKNKEDLTYKTTLPSWKNVGTYTYYARITGAGLATTYAQITLTITPAELIPSVMFTVDPSTSANDVEFIPTLEGALDETHTGTVTIKYTDKDGEQELTLDASDFTHDGETTSVYKEAITNKYI